MQSKESKYKYTKPSQNIQNWADIKGDVADKPVYDCNHCLQGRFRPRYQPTREHPGPNPDENASEKQKDGECNQNH